MRIILVDTDSHGRSQISILLSVPDEWHPRLQYPQAREGAGISVEEKLENIEVAAEKTWKVVAAWVGGISALIGLFASIFGGFTWLVKHHRHKVEYQAKMALAQTELSQKQYQSALSTCGEILKENPLDQAALDFQLQTAMVWVENFSLYVPEGKDEGDMSGTALDELFTVLNSGITRVKDARVADVQAHLGWAHFLNAKMAQREGDSVAQEDWRLALSKDPTNVYANAMLANWMLQSGGNLPDAIEHFRIAVGTGKVRPFVRRLQIGGLLHFEVPGARAELIRVVSAMRKSGEALDSGLGHRIASWCFDPIVTTQPQIFEALGAVPSDDAWQTYLWLEGNSEPDEGQILNRQFVHANLLELSGSRDAALSEYRKIEQTLKGHPGSLEDLVEAAIKRLTSSGPR